MLDTIHENMMAALVSARFEDDPPSARAAWSRMLQNGGWDDEEGRRNWDDMVRLGRSDLARLGYFLDPDGLSASEVGRQAQRGMPAPQEG